MGLPAKLKYFDVFADGQSWIGQVVEVSLPELKVKTESFRGGGMVGEVDINMGLEKLEMEVKLGGASVDAMRQFGRVGIAGVMLRYVGAYQDDATGGILPGELVVRGMHTALNPGTAKTGDNTEWTVKSTLSYLKWTLSGRVECEIDMLGLVWFSDGIDHLAEIRAALQR